MSMTPWAISAWPCFKTFKSSLRPGLGTLTRSGSFSLRKPSPAPAKQAEGEATDLVEHTTIMRKHDPMAVTKADWGMVHPTSQFMRHWDLVTLLLLLYTATVTPYEAGRLVRTSTRPTLNRRTEATTV